MIEHSPRSPPNCHLNRTGGSEHGPACLDEADHGFLLDDVELSSARDKLLGAGLRPTLQRTVLASLLFEGDHLHVTAESLHTQAASLRFDISMATVYNTLKCFHAAGLLRRIDVDRNRAYFDTNTSEHHHFFIEEQNLLIDIPRHLIQLEFPHVLSIPREADISRVDVFIRLRAHSRAGRTTSSEKHKPPCDGLRQEEDRDVDQ